MDPAEALDLLKALCGVVENDSLVPKMMIPPVPKFILDSLTGEEKIRASWFHSDDIPVVLDKLFVYNSQGYWWNA